MYSYANLLFAIKFESSELPENQSEQLFQLANGQPHSNRDIFVNYIYDDEEHHQYYFICYSNLVFTTSQPPFYKEIDPQILSGDASEAARVLEQVRQELQLPLKTPAWHLFDDHT